MEYQIAGKQRRAVEATVTTVGSPHKSKGQIVIAEDAVEIRWTITEELSQLGYWVYSAEDGQQALDFINTSPDPFFVLITDLDMPRLAGDQLIETIDQGNAVFAAYVMISGHSETYPPLVALRSRKTQVPLHFMPKPFEPDALLALLESIPTPKKGEAR